MVIWCEVWGVRCGVWGVRCEVWGVRCEVWGTSLTPTDTRLTFSLCDPSFYRTSPSSYTWAWHPPVSDLPCKQKTFRPSEWKVSCVTLSAVLELPWGTMSLHIFSISSTWARRGWRTPSSRLILVKRGFLRFRETFRSSLPVVLVFILPASRRDNITSNSEIYKMLLRSVSADSTEEWICISEMFFSINWSTWRCLNGCCTNFAPGNFAMLTSSNKHIEILPQNGRTNDTKKTMSIFKISG